MTSSNAAEPSTPVGTASLLGTPQKSEKVALRDAARIMEDATSGFVLEDYGVEGLTALVDAGWTLTPPPTAEEGGPLSPLGKSQGTVLERDVKDLAARPPRRCAACGGRGWRIDLDERCEDCNPCCEEHFPSVAMTPEEQAEHSCPACGWTPPSDSTTTGDAGADDATRTRVGQNGADRG